MASCSFHHTYKVVYALKESNGFYGAERYVDFVEAAMPGLSRIAVQEANGGPLRCSVWSVEQVD